MCPSRSSEWRAQAARPAFDQSADAAPRLAGHSELCCRMPSAKVIELRSYFSIRHLAFSIQDSQPRCNIATTPNARGALGHPPERNGRVDATLRAVTAQSLNRARSGTMAAAPFRLRRSLGFVAEPMLRYRLRKPQRAAPLVLPRKDDFRTPEASAEPTASLRRCSGRRRRSWPGARQPRCALAS